ncbi:MAG: hypothetical protein OQL11_12395 [Gammaproteobacteria bacterium]|jgi:hypothetical protein|nr:hypothetical protein [Gammaproteobacteria bacterium]
MDMENLTSRLRALIGSRLRYQGQSCRVIEILEPGPVLILQCENADGVIQANQYGDATRRVPRTINLSVLNEDGDDFHAEFLLLEFPEKP